MSDSCDNDWYVFVIQLEANQRHVDEALTRLLENCLGPSVKSSGFEWVFSIGKWLLSPDIS